MHSQLSSSLGDETLSKQLYIIKSNATGHRARMVENFNKTEHTSVIFIVYSEVDAWRGSNGPYLACPSAGSDLSLPVSRL
jgi:hypothetical protein